MCVSLSKMLVYRLAPCIFSVHVKVLFQRTELKEPVNVIGPKVKASRRISYAVLKLLIRENILVLPMRLNMAFTAA